MNTSAVRRSYRMDARAVAAAATGERILDAAEDLFWEAPTDGVLLAEVASRAGVTVQTVLRRHGSKEGLIAAAAARAVERVSRQRDEAPIGDVAGAVANLLDHYESHGDRAVRLLAGEHASATLGELTEQGRLVHRRWVERTFAPQLSGLRGAQRARRLAQLIAVTDVYTWKLLRRDAGLTRAQTERALVELIDGLEAG